MTNKLIETTKGRLFCGPYPSEGMLDLLKRYKTDVIWNLAAEMDDLLEAERECAKVVLFGEIEDYDIPKNEAAFFDQAKVVANFLNEDGRVFIHCYQGRGRSSTAVACIKMLVDGVSSAEALAYTKSTLNGPEVEEQIEFVKRIGDRIEKEKSNGNDDA